MATVKSLTGNAASATGLSRTTVMVSALAIMFILFTAARGSLPQYKAIFFGS